MKITFNTRFKSSFQMWADHKLLSNGLAYTNHNSLFYDMPDQYSPYYTFGAPFKNFVADSSITGATIMSGIWVGTSFTTKGNNNFIDIGYDQGQAYFDAQQSDTLSGSYSVKEYNISLTDKTEDQILFETKFEIAPQTTRNAPNTGLATNQEPYPSIFIIDGNITNDEAALGGAEWTKHNMRMLVFSDSLFSRDGVNGIFSDLSRTNFAIFDESDMPFNAFGGLISSYNYTGLSATKDVGNFAHIDRVRVSPLKGTFIQKGNSEIFASIIDFDIRTYRFPRG